MVEDKSQQLPTDDRRKIIILVDESGDFSRENFLSRGSFVQSRPPQSSRINEGLDSLGLNSLPY